MPLRALRGRAREKRAIQARTGAHHPAGWPASEGSRGLAFHLLKPGKWEEQRLRSHQVGLRPAKSGLERPAGDEGGLIFRDMSLSNRQERNNGCILFTKEVYEVIPHGYGAQSIH
jgi:hypothetical protein